MKVYFIGAGPGAPDLITVRGAEILKRCPMVLYAGSLIPKQMLAHCGTAAKIIDTSCLDLEQQTDCYIEARNKDWDIARLQSGDPAIYGAIAEQMRRLDELGIACEVVPGVSSFTAAAAVLRSELTKPAVSQSIILTRMGGRASSVPARESLVQLAQHGATLCIFLSGPHIPEIVETLRRYYKDGTPVALVYKVGWKNERTHVSTLEKLLEEIELAEWKLSTMMIVGDVLDSSTGKDSRLYAGDYAHRFRKPRVSVEVK